MKYSKLKLLDEKFAEDSLEMSKEFSKFFLKWKNKNPVVCMVNIIHLPVNIMLNILSISDNNEGSQLFYDFPLVFMRMARPFVKLKDEWGKTPDKEFVDKFVEIYESQFEKLKNE